MNHAEYVSGPFAMLFKPQNPAIQAGSGGAAEMAEAPDCSGNGRKWWRLALNLRTHVRPQFRKVNPGLPRRLQGQSREQALNGVKGVFAQRRLLGGQTIRRVELGHRPWPGRALGGEIAFQGA